MRNNTKDTRNITPLMINEVRNVYTELSEVELEVIFKFNSSESRPETWEMHRG